MVSPVDSALRSRNWTLAFAGAVAAASIWTIWGGDMFPAEPDPKGEPETWTKEQMRRWLEVRNLFPSPYDSEEQLLERIRANMRVPKK
ncbi:hypothetical protein VHEMI05574 [[Torrubiella] hemipterigena]|uniref:STE24 endopeptidase n=1 Tax=[Torrubiella] hemipterigena TaxID=1531966 RepID=A0A0A1T4M4_9HYPO|nr:hypothetical protein VHEMI05574 [[Torrubiella] hemipterigena]